MRRFYGIVSGKMAVVEGDENLHLKNVLRLREGEEIIVFNGDGNDYECVLSKVGKTTSECEIKKIKKCAGLPKISLALFMASVKGEKMEFILQKAVELGCSELCIFESEFSTMKLKDEKLPRYKKIMISACKQCERSDMMKLRFLSFDEMLERFASCKVKLFANERQGEKFDFTSLTGAKDVGVLIGSEGGFSQCEKSKILALGPENISLGKRILRAETAMVLLTGIAGLFSGN